MSEAFVGQIALFGFSFAPLNWAICNGQLLPKSQYQNLFNQIGNAFGGDGKSNFALPNLQGAAAVGQGTPPTKTVYALGKTGGVVAVALTPATDAPHTHPFQCATDEGQVNTPAGNLLAVPIAGTGREANHGFIYNLPLAGQPDVTLRAGSIAPLQGKSMPHNNLQPYLVLNYCICTSGVTPVRG